MHPLELPPDCWGIVLCNLGFRDMFNLALANRQYHAACKLDVHVMRSLDVSCAIVPLKYDTDHDDDVDVLENSTVQALRRRIRNQISSSMSFSRERTSHILQTPPPRVTFVRCVRLSISNASLNRFLNRMFSFGRNPDYELIKRRMLLHDRRIRAAINVLNTLLREHLTGVTLGGGELYVDLSYYTDELKQLPFVLRDVPSTLNIGTLRTSNYISKHQCDHAHAHASVPTTTIEKLCLKSWEEPAADLSVYSGKGNPLWSNVRRIEIVICSFERPFSDMMHSCKKRGFEVAKAGFPLLQSVCLIPTLSFSSHGLELPIEFLRFNEKEENQEQACKTSHVRFVYSHRHYDKVNEKNAAVRDYTHVHTHAYAHKHRQGPCLCEIQ